MKRKTLISIALIMIMLLNCIMPLFVVSAAEGEEIQLNSKLYFAVKASLTDQGFSFNSNDVTRTIVLSAQELSNVKELYLNEGGIYDLTGLDKFSNVTHLELSGNNLSKDSNLEVLNNLPLTHLDLSTNRIEDISGIEELINTIEENGGIVILSGQTVTMVSEAIIDIEEDSSIATTSRCDLPPILKEAGFIKAVWMNQGYYKETGSTVSPSLKSMSNPVTAGNNFIEVRIASDTGVPYYGMYALEIYIYDTPTEAAAAANLNPAATNKLNGSRFYIYVVVHSSDSQAIYTPDSNLYRAIKKQLTAGQEINPDLDSYPYSVDANGETVYDECTYITYPTNSDYLILTPVGSADPKYVLVRSTGTIYKISYDGTGSGSSISVDIGGTTYNAYIYNSKAEESIVETTADDGTITRKRGYKVAHLGERINLYKAAYDASQTFVIDDKDLSNRISSLILNNKEIRDLTGIEKFVGLNAYLNVSHNYLVDIEPIYKIQENREAFEAKLQEKFNYYLKDRQYGNLTKSLNEAKSYKSAADAELQQISATMKSVMEKFKEAAEIKQTKPNPAGGTPLPNDDYDKQVADKAKEIDDLLKTIWGYTETDPTLGTTKIVEGNITRLRRDLSGTVSNIKGVYGYLSNLYDVYNKEYKLTTLLTPELNYQDYEEYLAYEESLQKTTAEVRSLYAAVISRIVTLNNNQGLSYFEKEMLESEFHVVIPEPGETAGAGAYTLESYLQEINETPGNRLYWVAQIKRIREMALYAEMANYCLINRMEKDTASSQCYAEKYLMQRIENLIYEGLDTTLEEEVLKKVRDNVAGAPTDFYTIYKDYVETAIEYTNVAAPTETLEVKTCTGEYNELYNLIYNNTLITDISEVESRAGVTRTADNGLQDVYDSVTLDMLATIAYREQVQINSKTGQDEGMLYLYKEAVALASKFVTNSSEVSRYVVLSKLRKLDVSYNAYLGGIEKLGTLTGLRELYANANYITDLSEVDWSAIKYLRKLGIAYNYVTDIRPLENLANVLEIDASHNMISGKFEFNFSNVQETLQKLDLSYNQIEDITGIMQLLDGLSWGDDGDYLAKDDTIDIDLGHQSIVINIEDPIFLSEHPTTFNVELPKIFTQLMAIDVSRTAFGETSQDGRIESEGTYVTLNTRTVGDKKGVVEVVAMSGDGTPVETCVGVGTKAEIYYTVAARSVESVVITPNENIQMLLGEKKKFTAEVKGENLSSSRVDWTIEGNTSELTVISEDGELVIGEDEKAKEITIIATSRQDHSKQDSVVVAIPENEDEVTAVIIDPCANVAVNCNRSRQFMVTVEGRTENKAVEWRITGQTSSYTTITQEGLLSVGIDEKADYITVTAISDADKTKSCMVRVRIAPENEELPTISIVDIVNPAEDEIEAKNGDRIRFEVMVSGDAEDLTVNWSVKGNTSPNTKVLGNGILQIADDETSEKLYVTASSNYDSSKKDTVTVLLPENVKLTVTSIKIAPEANIAVKPGEEKLFMAIVEGTAEDKSVTWKVEGNTSNNTIISNDGKLTVAQDETSTNIFVIATSNYDTSKVAKVTVRIAGKSETIPEITRVTISPSETATLKAGEAKDYTVQVEGTAEDKTVTWKVEGNNSKNTVISSNGRLQVSSIETAEELTIKAISNYDTSKFATAKVIIEKEATGGEVTSVAVSPSANIEVAPGDEKTFTATVEGTVTDKSVTWRVSDNKSTNTTISQTGKLVVGSDETAVNIKVTATSKADTTKSGTVIVKITGNENPVENVQLGYTVKDEYLTGVKAKTPVEDFKAILIGTQNYKVVIKKNGSEITSGYVGTGMYAQIQDTEGNVVKNTNGDLLAFAIVVKGDATGDGLANSLDSSAIKAHRADVSILSGEYFEAADINNDGKVNTLDSKLLLYHRAEIEGYDLNYSK